MPNQDDPDLSKEKDLRKLLLAFLGIGSGVDPDLIKQKDFFKELLPAIIRVMLADGRLDKDKLNDREYVLNIISQGQNIIGQNIIGEVSAVIVMHETFIESAKDAINANRPEVAIVLIATATEQIVNTFYRNVLEEKRIFTSDEITEIIRTTNINAKVSWLLSIVADFVIDLFPEDHLQKDILKLMELRNQIVHYKAVPTPFLAEIPIIQRIQDYGLDKMLEIPDQLTELLDAALHNVRVEDPDYRSILNAIESWK